MLHPLREGTVTANSTTINPVKLHLLREGAVLDVALGARPFLRRDTFYADTEVGVQFSSTGPAFQLHGGGAFQLFE